MLRLLALIGIFRLLSVCQQSQAREIGSLIQGSKASRISAFQHPS